MRSADRSREISTVAALRQADASLSFVPDVDAFSARLALEPAPVPSVPRGPVPSKARAGRWRVRQVLAGAALVVAFSGSAVAMAQGAQPGGSLYGLKRASESVWLATSIGPQDRASRLLGLAERRAGEAKAAQRAGHPALALQAGRDALHDIKAAQALGPSLSPKEQNAVDERARDEGQKVGEVVGNGAGQSGDHHSGEGDGSSGPGTPSGGAPGSPGGSSNEPGIATPAPGGGTGVPGEPSGQQGTATTTPTCGGTGVPGEPSGQQGTATTPSCGGNGVPGESSSQPGTSTSSSGMGTDPGSVAASPGAAESAPPAGSVAARDPSVQ
jgi:hypothetical protein